MVDYLMNSLGIFFIKPKVKRGWNVDYYFYPYDEEINVVVKVECEYIFRWKKIYIFFIFSSHQNHSPSYNFVSGIDPILGDARDFSIPRANFPANTCGEFSSVLLHPSSFLLLVLSFILPALLSSSSLTLVYFLFPP